MEINRQQLVVWVVTGLGSTEEPMLLRFPIFSHLKGEVLEAAWRLQAASEASKLNVLMSGGHIDIPSGTMKLHLFNLRTSRFVDAAESVQNQDIAEGDVFVFSDLPIDAILGLSALTALPASVRVDDFPLTKKVTINELRQKVSEKPANAYYGSVYMGDVFKNSKNTQIINRSIVESAVNKLRSRSDDDTAIFIENLVKEVSQSNSMEAAELLDQFNEELGREEPRKSLLRRSWSALVEVLPSVAKIAGAAAALAKILG